MISHLAGRRLYLADLLRRQAALEGGFVPMHALGYRVLAKRLLAALAGQAPASLCDGFPELSPRLTPLLREALETRHFDELGLLHGPGAEDARIQTQLLVARMR